MAKRPRIKSVSQIERLTARQQDTRQRAFEALAKARRDNISLAKAGRQFHTTPRTIRNWAPSAVRKEGNRYRPSGNDSELRGPISYVEIVNGIPVTTTTYVRGYRNASKANAALRAQEAWLMDLPGAGAELAKWKGQTLNINGQRILVITDLDLLHQWGHLGEAVDATHGSG